MRWIKRIFITLTSLLIAAIAMIVTLFLLLDQNQLRDGLVYVVNRSTDHQLQINGPFVLDLSMSPAVQASDIYFKTAADDFELSAAEIHLQVDLSSLWSNYLIVHEIYIKDSVVNIRQLPDEEEDESYDPAEIKAPVIARLAVENLAINYSITGETEPLHITLESLKKDAGEDEEQIALTGSGSIDGKAFRIEGASGSVANLMTTDQPYAFNYHFEILQAVIHAVGRITNPHEAGDLDVALQINAPDLQDIMELLHASAPDIGSLAATGRLTGTIETPRLDDVDIKVSKDKAALQVSGAIGELFTLEDIALEYSTDVTDTELLAWVLPEQSPRFNSIKTAGKFSGSAGDLSLSDYTFTASDAKGNKLEMAGSTRIVDAPQPLRDLTATLSFASPDTAVVRQFNEAIPLLGPVAGTAHISMLADVLQIADIKLSVGNKNKLQIAASGDVKLAITAAEQSLAGLELDIDIQAPDTASLKAIAGTDVPAMGSLKGKAHVSDASGVAAITNLDIKVNKGKDFQLSLEGALADLEKLAGIDMKVELSASDLNTIGQLIGTPLPKEGPVKLSGRASGSLEKIHYTARTNLDNTSINTDVTGFFTGKRPRLAGSITIPDLDVHDIGFYPEKRVLPASTPAQNEFDQAASKQADLAEDLFSKEPIDFSGLNATDLDLEITIKKLSSTPKPITNIYSRVLLDNGKLVIKPMKFSVDNDVINNEVMINSSTKPPTLSLLTTGDDIDLGLLLASAASEKPLVRGVMTTRVDLKSRGQSPAALAASLGGEINVVTENARIDKSAMNLVTVDVIGWAISSMLSPNKDVNIDCAIIVMHFNKGMGTTDLHIIDTPDTLIRVDANVDLVKQTMDIAILPEHKVKLFKTKKDPMEIYGPIANPQYKLVSVKDLAQETGRAAFLAPLTISAGLLDSITGLIVEPDEPKAGSCDKFLK